MKKIIYGIAMLLLCSVWSCRKDDQVPGFDMIYRQQFTIPAGIGVFQVHHFYLKNIATRYEQLLEQHGKTDEEITGIITAQAMLTGVFGDATLGTAEKGQQLLAAAKVRLGQLIADISRFEIPASA